MVSQAFFYNAMFFSYGLILREYYAIPADRIGLYLLPFAIGNFLGPLCLGRLFDSVGRKPMIAFTYAASGVLLAITAVLFAAGGCWTRRPDDRLDGHLLLRLGGGELRLSHRQRKLPAGGPRLRHRAVLRAGHGDRRRRRAVAVRPLIESGSRGDIVLGYLFGAGLMLVAAVAALALGIRAERRPLEAVAPPLSRVE